MHDDMTRLLFEKKAQIPDAQDALAGRSAQMQIENKHFVNSNILLPPFPPGMVSALFGLGCFWGAERCFWQIEGVYTTAVGYAGGYTPNPTYEEVCSGLTGHNEVVLVVFEPDAVSYEKLLKVFFESHDPTQGMRQGNDVGTQYRSGIYTFDDAQQRAAGEYLIRFQLALSDANYGTISTEVIAATEFYYAEDYHQQYLAKNPGGYCGLGGTGVQCQTTVA